MNKKLFALVISSVFLLTSCSAVSSFELETDVSEQSSKANPVEGGGDDLPDFYRVRIYTYFSDSWGLIVDVTCLQSNLDYPIDGKVPVKIWIDGYEDTTTEYDTIHYTHNVNDPPEQYWWMGNHAGIVIDYPAHRFIHTIKAEIDPDNEIEETNENNNEGSYKVIIFPEKIFFSLFIRFLEIFPNTFPILRNLLEL